MYSLVLLVYLGAKIEKVAGLAALSAAAWRDALTVTSALKLARVFMWTTDCCVCTCSLPGSISPCVWLWDSPARWAKWRVLCFVVICGVVRFESG